MDGQVYGAPATVHDHILVAWDKDSHPLHRPLVSPILVSPAQHPSTLLRSATVLRGSCTAKLPVTEEDAVVSAQECRLPGLIKNLDEGIFKTEAFLPHAAASLACTSRQLPAKVITP